MPFLKFITHDLENNTLEAIWLEAILDVDGNVQEYRRVRCENYSAEQKADFLAACGEGADKYTTMAGW